MEKYNYTIKAIIISVILWLMESVAHRFIFSENVFEILPSETNELWMRIIIVFLVIIFGAYADKHTITLLKKEQEKRIIFNATIGSTQHILNNLLNQMQLPIMLAEQSMPFDSEDMILYKQSIEEGKELVEKLSSVDELTEDNIKDSVYPKSEK